jgi:transposase
MRAFDPEVVDAIWQTIEGLLPGPDRSHPLGCHRLRVADRVCFEGILIRLVTGCAWVDAERILGGAVSDTTLRARREEWLDAGVFDRLAAEAIAAYDCIVGLDFVDCTVDGSQHKAPAGRRRNRPVPGGSRQTRMEVVPVRRRQRHPRHLDHRRRQPQRLHPPRAHPGRRRTVRPAQRLPGPAS